MLRILDIPLHEISLDPAGASERLNAAAVRGAGLHVVGLAALGGRLQVFLESPFIPGVYRFAPVAAESGAELIGEVRSRYDAGFSTLGVFELGPERWGLFRRTGADE